MQFWRDDTQARTDWLRQMQQIVVAIILATLVAVSWLIFRPLVARIKRQTTKLDELAHHDPLTGLRNRRAFFKLAESELEFLRQRGRAMSIVIFDIDHFKAVNDRHGHAVGDAVLRWFAETMQISLRKTEAIGRIGGEEFVLLVPEANLAKALKVAERLRRMIEVQGPPDLPAVTVSAGVTEIRPDDASVMTALARADAALYEAKRLGRNRAVAAKDQAANLAA